MPRIRIEGTDTEVEFDPDAPPDTGTGQPGSILDILTAHDFLIDHICGGKCECTTCHVWIQAGAEHIPAPEMQEDDRLDLADGLRAESRLACQAVPRGDITLRIPE